MVATHTTPDPVEFNALVEMLLSGEYAFMEVSSLLLIRSALVV